MSYTAPSPHEDTVKGNSGVRESPSDIRRANVTASHAELVKLKAIRRHYASELANVERPNREVVVDYGADVRRDVIEFILGRMERLDGMILAELSRLADLGAL